MGLIFRLPLLLVEMLLRAGVDHLAALVSRLLSPRRDEQAVPDAGLPGDDGRPGPTAEDALERRSERDAAAPVTPSPTAPDPLHVHDHIDAETEVVASFGPAEDVGGTISVDPPWAGYDDEPAGAIVARLRDADPATKAVVALYERGHKARATVLRAAR